MYCIVAAAVCMGLLIIYTGPILALLLCGLYITLFPRCVLEIMYLNRFKNHMRGGIKPQFMRVFIDAIMIICEFGYSLESSYVEGFEICI